MNQPQYGGPAFPQIETCAAVDRDFGQPFSNTYSFGGMSLRDYFAAKAMHSVMCNRENIKVAQKHQNTPTISAFVAKISYEMADAMLAAREKKA